MLISLLGLGKAQSYEIQNVLKKILVVGRVSSGFQKPRSGGQERLV